MRFSRIKMGIPVPEEAFAGAFRLSQRCVPGEKVNAPSAYSLCRVWRGDETTKLYYWAVSTVTAVDTSLTPSQANNCEHVR